MKKQKTIHKAGCTPADERIPMSKQKKTIAAAIVLVALLVAAFICWRVFAPTANVGSKTISVTITHADGTSKTEALSTDAETLWDAMREKDLIDGTDSDYGKWVTTVDGETADEANGQFWMFTRGGEWVDTACDTTYIADGESYEFFIYVS